MYNYNMLYTFKINQVVLTPESYYIKNTLPVHENHINAFFIQTVCKHAHFVSNVLKYYIFVKSINVNSYSYQ